jgi:hypothetical protein
MSIVPKFSVNYEYDIGEQIYEYDNLKKKLEYYKMMKQITEDNM